MWVLKRTDNGMYRAKEFTGRPDTRFLMFAEKYFAKSEALANASDIEKPEQIDPYDYFKGGDSGTKE
jgi:hypothetical protein